MTTALIEQVGRLTHLVRAGTSLHSAVHEVAHSHPDSLFHQLVVALSRDLTLGAAVDTLDPADDDERLVVLVLTLAARVGGDIAAQLDSLLATLGEREQARSERKAHVRDTSQCLSYRARRGIGDVRHCHQSPCTTRTRHRDAAIPRHIP